MSRKLRIKLLITKYLGEFAEETVRLCGERHVLKYIASLGGERC